MKRKGDFLDIGPKRLAWTLAALAALLVFLVIAFRAIGGVTGNSLI